MPEGDDHYSDKAKTLIHCGRILQRKLHGKEIQNDYIALDDGPIRLDSTQHATEKDLRFFQTTKWCL